MKRIFKNLFLNTQFVSPVYPNGLAGAICILFFLVIFTEGLLYAQPLKENGNGTLLDQGTGLVWQKGDSSHELKRSLNWYEALEYVDKKNFEKFGGYENWRLPTLQEFNKLFDPSLPLKSIKSEPIGLPKEFKEGGSYYLWTSNERGLDNAWYFGLGQKENYFNLKDLSDLDQAVKMVRNGR